MGTNLAVALCDKDDTGGFCSLRAGSTALAHMDERMIALTFVYVNGAASFLLWTATPEFGYNSCVSRALY